MSLLLTLSLTHPAGAATGMVFGSSALDPTFETTAMPPHPDLPGFSISSSNLGDLYTQFFGGPSPNTLPFMTWGETDQVLAMTFDGGGAVDKSQDFTYQITGNYWTVKTTITFNPATGPIIDPNDHVSLKGFVQHHGKLSQNDVPHEADAAEGPVIPYEIDMSAGNKKPFDIFGDATGANQAAFAHHPNNIDHFDFQSSALFGRVFSEEAAGIDFFDHIFRWNGQVTAVHLPGPLNPTVPEPATFLLLAGGLAVLLMRGKK